MYLNSVAIAYLFLLLSQHFLYLQFFLRLWWFFFCLGHLGCFVFPHSLFMLSSHSVVSDSLWTHGLQHARLPCPSLSPGVCSNSSSQWFHPTLILLWHHSPHTQYSHKHLCVNFLTFSLLSSLEYVHQSKIYRAGSIFSLISLIISFQKDLAKLTELSALYLFLNMPAIIILLLFIFCCFCRFYFNFVYWSCDTWKKWKC